MARLNFQLVTSCEEIKWLVVSLIGLVLLVFFIGSIALVCGYDLASFDRDIFLMMRSEEDITDPKGPIWMEEVARDVTSLGGVIILIMISFFSIAYLYFIRSRVLAVLIFGSVLSGFIVNSLLKYVIDRPRPSLVPHEAAVYTASFPSAHAMMAACVYLTLAVLFARIHKGRCVKVCIITSALVVVCMVGISRVYLGVHWPTDVVAGWFIGAVWVCVVFIFTNFLESKYRVFHNKFLIN